MFLRIFKGIFPGHPGGYSEKYVPKFPVDIQRNMFRTFRRLASGIFSEYSCGYSGGYFPDVPADIQRRVENTHAHRHTQRGPSSILTMLLLILSLRSPLSSLLSGSAPPFEIVSTQDIPPVSLTQDIPMPGGRRRLRGGPIICCRILLYFVVCNFLPFTG